MAAFGAWNRAEALREVDRREAERTKTTRPPRNRGASSKPPTWQAQVTELAQRIQRSAKRFHSCARRGGQGSSRARAGPASPRLPMVAVAIASRQDLLDVMQSGDVEASLRLIRKIEGVFEMVKGRSHGGAGELQQQVAPVQAPALQTPVRAGSGPSRECTTWPDGSRGGGSAAVRDRHGLSDITRTWTSKTGADRDLRRVVVVRAMATRDAIVEAELSPVSPGRRRGLRAKNLRPTRVVEGRPLVSVSPLV